MRTLVMPTTMLLARRLSLRRLIGGLIAVAMVGFPTGPEATVFAGVDTLVVGGGFDFSEPLHISRYSKPTDDIELAQIQDLNTITADEGGLHAAEGIRDMGSVLFGSLVTIPSELQPDPDAAIYEAGRPLVWSVSMSIREGHLYVVWTQEWHIAKIFIEDIRSFTDDNPALDRGLWGDFISRVIFRWAYQDDASRSFAVGTVVQNTTWGWLKFFFKEDVQ